MYKPELEDVLKRHLGRVGAPDELWERIENPQARVTVPKTQTKMYVPMGVAAMVLLAAVVFHPRPVEVEYRLPQHNITLRVSKATRTTEALNAACQLCHSGA
ncbi:MAG TPA: hypothetical protein VH157_01615 [Bryobacteraceae bacterium]|nr:hypothetical protein [Bryobacteraceae bacterium]